MRTYFDWSDAQKDRPELPSIDDCCRFERGDSITFELPFEDGAVVYHTIVVKQYIYIDLASTMRDVAQWVTVLEHESEDHG